MRRALTFRTSWGVKQPSQAAAVHLLDGRGNFLFMRAEDLDGNLLFEVPGFTGRNGLPTITCINTSPLSGTTARVTGYIAPS